jgi:hypothetical protein
MIIKKSPSALVAGVQVAGAVAAVATPVPIRTSPGLHGVH